MSFEPETEPLKDAELELVIGVIRRGLKEGDRIENLEERLASAAVAIQEAARRMKEMNRIGQEVCRSYERALNPNRKVAMTVAEVIERGKWIQEKSRELKAQLE